MRILFQNLRISKKASTPESYVRAEANLFPIMHYHSPCPMSSNLVFFWSSFATMTAASLSREFDSSAFAVTSDKLGEFQEILTKKVEIIDEFYSN